MNILISTNEFYIEQTLVMLNSLKDHHRSSSIAVHLFYKSLTLASVLRIESHCTNLNLQFYAYLIDDSVISDFKIKNNVSIETFYRLLLSDYLEDKIDRILYIDVDTLICGPLDSMYSHVFEENKFIAACPNWGEKKSEENLHRLHVMGDYKYINAGVLLINVKDFKKKVRIEDIKKFYIENEAIINYEDQDVINGLYFQHIDYLDSKYNCIPSLEKDARRINQAKILHFAGSSEKKPWNINYIGGERDLYASYAHGTSLYCRLTEKPHHLRLHRIISLFYYKILKRINRQLKLDGENFRALLKKIFYRLKRI